MAEAAKTRNAEEDYEYGMALAHLQRWMEAAAILEEGRRQCPGDERFPLELAGVAFQQKDYPRAAGWIRKALRLAPRDEYAINFAGTTYFLMGNVDAALKYWNRLHKPSLAELHIDSGLRTHRLLVERAFAFAPQSELLRSQYAATESRLRSLEIFPAFNISLAARSDGKFDVNFNTLERNGFGSTRLQALISTFGGAFYETIYPAYFNVGGSAINFQSLFRWDAQKRRAWFSAEGPLNELPQWRWNLAADLRNENWVVRRSFTGDAPELGGLNLHRQTVTGTLSGLPRGALQWTTGAEISHRSFRQVNYGSALNGELVTPGVAIKHLASLRDRIVDLPERRFTVDGAASSEFGRLWAPRAELYEKLQGSAVARWFPRASGDRYEARQQLRAGRTFGNAPFDELYMLGVERDNDLWLRGMIGTRDGRKGSSPLATSYLLSNIDFGRRVYSNGLVTVRLGPWLDIARASAPTLSLAPHDWLFDAGVEARVTVLGTGVVLTWGRDLRTGTNAFYGTLSGQHW